MLEQTIGRIASRQLGLITHDQLREIGLTQRQIDRRTRDGLIDPLFPEVFRLAGTVAGWEQDLFAVVLSAGDGAAASHLSGAVVWGVPGFQPGPLEAVRLHQMNRRLHGAYIHGSRYLPEHLIARHLKIPVVTPELMLLQLCATQPFGRVERAVDNALAMQLTTPLRLHRTFDELACRGRPGIAMARAILGPRGEGYVAPASDIERKFLKLIRKAGLPEPVREMHVGNKKQWLGRVEFVWPDRKVMVQCDSRRYHTALLDRRRDNARDRKLTAAGWTVLHVWWDELRDDPASVEADVRTSLGLA